MSSIIDKRYTDSIRIATELARSDRDKLVPFLGAGVSLPLGLPNWQTFTQLLCEGTGLNFSQNSALAPPDILQKISEYLKPKEFIKRVQHSLTLPSQRTTLTLLALTRTKIKRIVTTNLDFSVENSFALSGNPIPPSQVLSGWNTSDLLAPFAPALHSIQLFKIHGSLERPKTWVLTREQYDKAYAAQNDLEAFITHSIDIPFFIGSSLADYDIEHCLRISALTHGKRSYAVLPISLAERIDERFRNKGVTPIYFYDFDQIPEILDDIFNLAPLNVLEIVNYSSHEQTLSFSGIKFEISKSGFDDRKNLAMSIFANALEGCPNQSLLDQTPRRGHGIKGLWKRHLQDFLSKAKCEEEYKFFSLLTATLLQCPELVLDSLLPSLLCNNSIDIFSSVSAILSATEELPDIKNRILAALSCQVHDAKLSLSALRAVAKILSEAKRHPAQMFPPSTVKTKSIEIMVYPLTRYQVGILKSDNDLRNHHPVHPYTLEYFSEEKKIIERLSEETSRNWRIPTNEEWLVIAGNRSNDSCLPADVWPWGTGFLTRGRHAHLNFCNEGGGIAKHTLEVGVFPLGKSVDGLFDIIGNVYELCINKQSGEYLLAGGAWTKEYRGENPDSFRWITRKGSGSSNVGLRLICDPCFV